MAMACSSAMLTAPPACLAGTVAGSALLARFDGAGRRFQLHFRREGGASDGRPLEPAAGLSGALSKGLGAALLAFFLAAFLVAAFGIGKM
jgi:hypothetical protein